MHNVAGLGRRMVGGWLCVCVGGGRGSGGREVVLACVRDTVMTFGFISTLKVINIKSTTGLYFLTFTLIFL